MRFGHCHKVSSYLMMWCAYLALVMSGQLGLIPVVLSLVGVIASWWWEPPRIRYDRYTRLWTVVSIIVFLYSVAAAVFLGDVLLVGAEFLLYLTVAKLCNRRASRDYQQIYMLSFLMLVAGTVLNSELTYGIFFLGFVVSSTWALILFHLRREMEDNFFLKRPESQAIEKERINRILSSRRIVGKPFFLGTSVVSISIFAFASVMFLLIPRVGFGVFFQNARKSVAMSGFSDGVKLGGHGVIKTDKSIVMRVEVDEKFEGRNAPYIHWRGVAFDMYKGGSWQRSRFAPKTRRYASSPERRVERHYLLYDKHQIPKAELVEALGDTTRQDIYLEPNGYDVLFGAAMPMAFEFDYKPQQRPRTERNDEIRYRHEAGVKYVAYSSLAEPDTADMRRATGNYPPDYRVYLDIPDEVPDRVRQLARNITKDKRTIYDKVKAIETWLKNNLGYTLVMKDPRGQEPIDYFLFERKEGHCEYFSSAMAIMVRELGVPSRNVNGFLGGEWNEYEDYIAVRAGDAHSWVEVYLDSVGWVTFDPTPAAQVDQLGRGGPGLLDRMRRFIDTIKFKWFKWVIEYDLYRQLALFKDIGKSLGFGKDGSVKDRLRGIKDWASKHKAKAGLAGLAFGLVIGGILLVTRRKKTTRDMLGAGKRRSRSRIATIYAQVLARLARRGYRRDPAVTPREYARDLSDRGVPGAESLNELTVLYYAAEYAERKNSRAESRARELKRSIFAAKAKT